MQPRDYTLGELADAAAMTERNVRAYASRGLLPPTRRTGRHATYGAEHVARLRLVRALHRHGLTLRVIGDLVERGTADAELARLSREELPTGVGSVLVPMSAEIVETYQREHPGGMQALVDAHLITRSDGRYVASATALGIVAALSARGIGVEESAAVSLCAAAAASGCARELGAVLDVVHEKSDSDDDELKMLVIQLAASSFADVLGVRLSPPRP